MSGEGPRDRDQHPDHLLWYVAGKLDPVEGREVRAHLEGCTDCRVEAEALASMRSSLRALATRVEGHIDVEDLVAFEDQGPAPSPDLRAEVQAHLEGCKACSEDLASLVRARNAPPRETSVREAEGGPPEARVPPATRVRGARPPWAWGLAAAVILAAILIPFVWNPGPPSPTFTFLPSHRGAGELPALGAGGHWSVEVVLPFEAPDGRYAVRIGMDDGSVVVHLPPAESGGGRLTLDVPAPDEPGTYWLILQPPTEMPGAPYEYPFQVVSGGVSEGSDP